MPDAEIMARGRNVGDGGINTSWREKKKGWRDENNGERGRKKGSEAKIRAVESERRVRERKILLM